MRRAGRLALLTLTLSAVWLLLSGHYTSLLLAFGALSVALVVWLALRMHIVDLEGQPLELGWRLIPYWAYLVTQILRANIDVIGRLVHFKPPISPTVVETGAGQHSDVGRVLLANSITLTPGTVSLDVREHAIQVHALSQTGATELGENDMDRRVSWVERGRT